MPDFEVLISPPPSIFSNIILLMLLSPTGVIRDLSLYATDAIQIASQCECYSRQGSIER